MKNVAKFKGDTLYYTPKQLPIEWLQAICDQGTYNMIANTLRSCASSDEQHGVANSSHAFSNFSRDEFIFIKHRIMFAFPNTEMTQVVEIVSCEKKDHLIDVYSIPRMLIAWLLKASGY